MQIATEIVEWSTITTIQLIEQIIKESGNTINILKTKKWEIERIDEWIVKPTWIVLITILVLHFWQKYKELVYSDLQPKHLDPLFLPIVFILIFPFQIIYIIYIIYTIYFIIEFIVI